MDEYSEKKASDLLHTGSNVNERNDDNQTPLHSAAFTGRIRTVRALLRFGANPRIECRCSGMNPLHQALGDGRILSKAGAPVKPKSRGAKNSFWMAIAHGSVESVQFLLKEGVDPNSRDEIGTTALHLAIFEEPWDKSSFLIMRELLRKGANPYLKDKKGRNPYEWLRLIQEGQNPITGKKILASIVKELEPEYYKKWAILAVCTDIFPKSAKVDLKRCKGVSRLKHKDVAFEKCLEQRKFNKVQLSADKEILFLRTAQETSKTLSWARRFLSASK